MKSLTIREPFASLIKNEVKYIETRSYKTKYRGDILIHSSKKKYPFRDSIKHLINEEELEYGKILCIAKLTDCVLIDKEYQEKVMKEDYNNYLCGNYELNRYAWVLEDIRVVKPISVKGQLGLWNYNGIIEIIK